MCSFLLPTTKATIVDLALLEIAHDLWSTVSSPYYLNNPGFGPGNAIDGLIGPDNSIFSGNPPFAWIQIDFGRVEKVRWPFTAKV